jgi:hypothetical protein
VDQRKLDVGSSDGREDACEDQGAQEDTNDSGDFAGGSTWPALP